MRRRLPERRALRALLGAAMVCVAGWVAWPRAVEAAPGPSPSPGPAQSAIAPAAAAGTPLLSAVAVTAVVQPRSMPPTTGRGGLCPSGGLFGSACGVITGGPGAAVGAAGKLIGGAAGDLAGQAAAGAGKAVTTWIADGATGLLLASLDFAQSSLDPGFTATASCPGCVGATSGLGPYLHRMRALAAACAVVFLLFSVVLSVLRADPAVLGVALRQLAFAALLTVVLVWGTRLLMEVADQMTSDVIGDSLQNQATTFVSSLAATYSTSIDSGTVSLFLIAVSALLTVLVGFLLWIEFAIRTAIIELAVLFFPLLLAAAVWAPAARAARRLADVLVTAIFSKFLILTTLGLAAGVFAAAPTGPLSQGIGQFAVGVVLLLLTVLAPIALLSFVSHAPEAAHMYAGIHRGGGAAAMGAAQRHATTLASAGAGGGGAAAGAAGGEASTPVITGPGRTASTSGGAGSGGAEGGAPPAPAGPPPGGPGGGSAGPPGEQPPPVIGRPPGLVPAGAAA